MYPIMNYILVFPFRPHQQQDRRPVSTFISLELIPRENYIAGKVGGDVHWR